MPPQIFRARGRIEHMIGDPIRTRRFGTVKSEGHSMAQTATDKLRSYSWVAASGFRTENWLNFSYLRDLLHS